MEHPAQPAQTDARGATGTTQIAYSTTPSSQSAAMVTGAPATFSTSPGVACQHQLPYQQVQHHHHHQQQLRAFWANQMLEVEQSTDFKNHSLPLARIKKIMKADEDVRMISAEAPVVFAKACEMFILELTLRSWIQTEENKRRTLQKGDIAAAITRTDIFDFLVDIVPRDEFKEEGLGIPRAALPTMGILGDSIPYYYIPPHHVPVSGVIMNNDGNQSAGVANYGTQQPRPVA